MNIHDYDIVDLALILNFSFGTPLSVHRCECLFNSFLFLFLFIYVNPALVLYLSNQPSKIAQVVLSLPPFPFELQQGSSHE